MLLRLPGSVAPPAPAPVVERVRHQPMTWTLRAPWLDRSWNLTDVTGPVVKIEGGALAVADPTHWWSEAAAIPGAAWDGSRTPRTTTTLNLLVQGDNPDDYLDNHAAFVEALDPAREAILRITLPNGRWREIGCRYEGAPQTHDLDVLKAAYEPFEVTWSHPDPYWRGPAEGARFANVELPPFYPFPPLIIGPSTTLDSGRITNPGQVEAAAAWRVAAPFAGFSVGVGKSLVEMELTKTTGYVEIDMDPRRLTMVDETGAAIPNSAVTAFDPSLIPPGTTDLVTTVEGAGVGTAVELSFRPGYRRPY